MRLLAYLPLLVLVGCVPSSEKPSQPDASTVFSTAAMHEGEAVTADEKAVAVFVIDNADNPKSVEFARWGPNVIGKEYADMVKDARAANDALNKRQDAATKTQWDAEDKAKAVHGEKPDIHPNISSVQMGFNPIDNPGNYCPPFFSAPPTTENVKAFVRVKYRAANGGGGKQMVDGIYSITQGDQPKVTLVGFGSDDWFESLKQRLNPKGP